MRESVSTMYLVFHKPVTLCTFYRIYGTLNIYKNYQFKLKLSMDYRLLQTLTLNKKKKRKLTRSKSNYVRSITPTNYRIVFPKLN